MNLIISYYTAISMAISKKHKADMVKYLNPNMIIATSLHLKHQFATYKVLSTKLLN